MIVVERKRERMTKKRKARETVLEEQLVLVGR